MVKIKVNVMIYMYCIFLLYYMSASASLSFYRAFLLFYLCIFVCILCRAYVFLSAAILA